MVNANLFSIKHPFTRHRRRFIAVSPIKKRILKFMYICTYICTYVHSMYIWFKYFCLANANTRKIKAKATFYDLCVLRNFESTEQYLSAKWVIIDAPTVYWWKHVSSTNRQGVTNRQYQESYFADSLMFAAPVYWCKMVISINVFVHYKGNWNVSSTLPIQ